MSTIEPARQRLAVAEERLTAALNGTFVDIAPALVRRFGLERWQLFAVITRACVANAATAAAGLVDKLDDSEAAAELANEIQAVIAAWVNKH